MTSHIAGPDAGPGRLPHPPPWWTARRWLPRTARGRQGLVAWVFALPFLALFVAFMAGPLLASLGMSFTDITSRDSRAPWAVDFVGFDQYAKVLGDELFHTAAFNTAYFVVVGIPLTMACGLAAAVALDKGVNKLRTFFRVGYYLPVVSSIVAISVVWRFLLEPDYGIINSLLGYLGIEGPRWLFNQWTAMPSLIVMAAWRNLGFLMVVFLAGLQTIPKELYEAAQIDGATAWQRFCRVTLPMLRPTMLFAAVITGIGYLQFFEEPFVMTNGGPLDSTRSVTFDIYQLFGTDGDWGTAAAMSYILFVVIAAVTFLQFRILRPKGGT
jgi:multiple sugar transport system permease protein